MIEIGVFHNGASDLPVTRLPDQSTLISGELDEVHHSMQRVVRDQVKQAVLADELGYDYWFQTEHHFQPEGAEFSPNPIVCEAAVATQTESIRLGQLANITPWWHPVRLAEQAAMLDIISGGRLEFGIGRGYQPREAELLGRPYGGGVQDQERNRAIYEEAYEVIIKAWTEPSFAHIGEFFSIPPRYTTWNHPQTINYFTQHTKDRRLEDVLELGESTSNKTPVFSRASMLREISVFPQPLQKPYPQIWQPMTSTRSAQWAARHGINGVYTGEANDRVRRDLELYYEEAERCGWPDRLDRGRPRFGWDSDKKRGVALTRVVHVVDKDIGDQERADLGVELTWDYLVPFNFGAALSGPDDPPFDPTARVTPDRLDAKGITIIGSRQAIIDGLLGLKEVAGYEDFIVLAQFELGGFTGPEIEDQMRCFADDILPVLAKECGGRPPRRGSILEPEGAVSS